MTPSEIAAAQKAKLTQELQVVIETIIEHQSRRTVLLAQIAALAPLIEAPASEEAAQ